MSSEPVITKNIPVSYETDDVKVSFEIEFGKGNDGYNTSSYERTAYEEPYDIENHDINSVKMYCLLANEGPFVLKVTNVNVVSKKDLYKKIIDNGYIKYNYGITTVLDMNKEPIYYSPISFTPSNDVERDGQPWIVPNNKILKVDQNGQAMFQWSSAKALDKGVKPTPEQELMGVEERHENSGMIYLTFQPMYQEETIIEYAVPEVTRGLTRGFNLEPPVTRGFTSHAARVGYGSRAETKSKTSTAIAVPNSRYILPIRIRIIGDNFDPNIKCAKDLKSAMRVEELQKNTGVLPDY
jgi:hypothetical protein